MADRVVDSRRDRCAAWRSILTETPLPVSVDVGVALQRLVLERLDGAGRQDAPPAR